MSGPGLDAGDTAFHHPDQKKKKKIPALMELTFLWAETDK